MRVYSTRLLFLFLIDIAFRHAQAIHRHAGPVDPCASSELGRVLPRYHGRLSQVRSRVIRSICRIEAARKTRGLAPGNIGSFQKRSQLDQLSRGPAGCSI